MSDARATGSSSDSGTPDAIVVGSGPNGLAAAVTLARAGLEVLVLERASTIGGGARSGALTIPGFTHDLGSAVHPLALSSGFFRRFELAKRIRLIVPEISYGHPLDGGRAGLAYRDLERAVEALGADGPAWRQLFAPLVQNAHRLAQLTGSPLLQLPRHPVTLLRFGLRALEQGLPSWNVRFADELAPAMLSGLAAHSIRPMPSLSTSAAALMLGTTAHARGWPIPQGGSQAITDALADDLRAHGGSIVTGAEVGDIRELPAARAVLFDTSPRALSRIAGNRLPKGYRERLEGYEYGNGVAKVDFALSGPVPWANEELRRTPTLHLGGSREEIAAGEAEVEAGRHPESPYVLVAQPTVVDPSRAPEGQHTLWAYTHVPHGSTVDREEAIVAQIERFAPGFRELIRASSSRTAAQMQQQNANYLGGDIAVGEPTLAQLVARPVLSREPWRTPAAGVYLCSSATPPGPGVHGLAGYYAARSALRHEFGYDLHPYLGTGSPGGS